MSRKSVKEKSRKKSFPLLPVLPLFPASCLSISWDGEVPVSVFKLSGLSVNDLLYNRKKTIQSAENQVIGKKKAAFP
jgi:hypothetical protein